MIIDSSKPVHAATLTAAHVSAIGRYLGQDCMPGFGCMGKNLSKGELADLTRAGIDVFLAFEYAAEQALGGFKQGVTDANLATAQLRDLGLPAGMGVYFALDFDIRDYAPGTSDPVAKLGPAADYFRGIHSVKPAFQVGGYGGFYAVSRLFDAKLITLGWQTIAWSAGQRDKRAQLYQTASQVLGGDIDILEVAATVDWGQYPRPKAADHAFPPGRHVADGTASLGALAARQNTDVTAIWHATFAGLAADAKPPGPLEDKYLDAGRWDAKMPKGMVLWLP